ncbi:MAG TPA: hypothetical protein EYG67_00090 [Campylobacterales bacterium]|nr:hypothetical protein [Campylobacterales bacterium]HIP42034.1 hypothetical protein [Campylobacterales bacterium]
MMYHDRHRNKQNIGFWEWFPLMSIVIFYPMLVSIYTILPPLIGIAGLVIITNIDRNKVYALAGMLYLINLDLNLTLPSLLSLFSAIIIYALVYPTTKLMIRCKKCLALFLIILMNAIFYTSLFLYDIIFSSKTIVADSMLILYILLDILIGLFL